MLSSSEKRIISFALSSRILYFFISILSNIIIPDHKPSDVFLSANIQSSETAFDVVVKLLFGGLVHWDSEHFFHVAQNGYTYEHNLAFFPLYPTILSFLSNVLLQSLRGYLNSISCLILSSVLLNLVLFVSSAVILYRLSVIVLNSDDLACKSALFYCVSPASIFFIACYSETLYAFLVFYGMLENAKGNLYYASIFYGLATHARSNGLINVGFIIHYSLFTYYNFFLTCVKFNWSAIRVTFIITVRLVICSLVVVSPYIIFQVYGYLLYCTDHITIHFSPEIVNYGRLNSFVMPFDKVTWCNNTLPLPYSYVQNHYWNVGLFKYYTLKQIPNFLLAAPIIATILCYGIVYLKYYWNLLYLIRYIYLPHLKPKIWRCPRNNSLLPRCSFVFIIHVLFLTIFCLLFINVQVTTRILCSSSPIIYWIIVKYFTNNRNDLKGNVTSLNCFPFNISSSHLNGNILKYYFISYTFIGIVLFSNNYPWT